MSVGPYGYPLGNHRKRLRPVHTRWIDVSSVKTTAPQKNMSLSTCSLAHFNRCARVRGEEIGFLCTDIALYPALCSALAMVDRLALTPSCSFTYTFMLASVSSFPRFDNTPRLRTIPLDILHGRPLRGKSESV